MLPFHALYVNNRNYRARVPHVPSSGVTFRYVFDIINVNPFEHRTLNKNVFHILRRLQAETSVNIDNKLHYLIMLC